MVGNAHLLPDEHVPMVIDLMSVPIEHARLQSDLIRPSCVLKSGSVALMLHPGHHSSDQTFVAS
jgi:hypothetical protein